MRYRYKLDPHELRELLRRTPKGGCAIDIGAHKGAYTWWLARRVGNGGRVVSVEPQPELAHRLKAAFSRRRHVAVVHAAMAPYEGVAMLSTRSLGPSHGASIHGFPDGQEARRIEVPALTLRSLIERHGLERVDVIKCDAEGAELGIFGASLDVLARFRPIVLCECEERHAVDGASTGEGTGSRVAQFVRTFEGAGYEARLFFGGRLLPAASFDAARHQVVGSADYGNNFLMLPRV